MQMYYMKSIVIILKGDSAEGFIDLVLRCNVYFYFLRPAKQVCFTSLLCTPTTLGLVRVLVAAEPHFLSVCQREGVQSKRQT